MNDKYNVYFCTMLDKLENIPAWARILGFLLIIVVEPIVIDVIESSDEVAGNEYYAIGIRCDGDACVYRDMDGNTFPAWRDYVMGEWVFRRGGRVWYVSDNNECGNCDMK